MVYGEPIQVGRGALYTHGEYYLETGQTVYKHCPFKLLTGIENTGTVVNSGVGPTNKLRSLPYTDPSGIESMIGISEENVAAVETGTEKKMGRGPYKRDLHGIIRGPVQMVYNATPATVSGTASYDGLTKPNMRIAPHPSGFQPKVKDNQQDIGRCMTAGLQPGRVCWVFLDIDGGNA